MVTSIAIAGKGGTGKSTIAALIILALIEKNKTPVLAVDADADSNLATLLGVEVSTSVGDLREEVRQEMKNFPAGMSKAHYVESELHQIMVENAGFDLITMGRGEGPGCYCYLNSLIKKFSDDLMPSYKWVVMDNEAGLEHISRRTSTNVDALIVVVTDNSLSFQSAKKIEEITRGLKNQFFHLYVVTNMVKDARKKDIQERVSGLSMEYLSDIPYDPELEDLIYRGEPLTGFNGSQVHECISTIIDRVDNGKE